MNKREFLTALSHKIETGELSRAQVLKHLDVQNTEEGEHAAFISALSYLSITKILYVLGAAIVIVGMFIFITQIWEDIASAARILITLGLGILLTALGSVLLAQKPHAHIGAVFHSIGGVLVPVGALVLLDELSAGVVSLWPVAIAFGVIFAFYMALTIVHKTSVLTFFSIMNGTAFLYMLVAALMEGAAYRPSDIYAYLTMVVGFSYYFLAHAFKETWNNRLVGLLYFLAIVGFLGAAFSQVVAYPAWHIIFFLCVMGGFLLSTYTKSKSMLVVSTLFLIAHITFITDEYFADSLGWPVSLVILGFVVIALGYASITINKKCLQKHSD